MPSNRPLKLGIVGGLGALAGADILNKIVNFTPVKSESDHREISFEQKPLIEPVSAAQENYTPAHRKFYVFDTLQHMEKNGCDAAILPCFITHTFIEELRAELNIKIISMTEAISDHINQHHGDCRNIGILTTKYVRASGLFESMLGERHNIIYPEQNAEAELMNAIYGSDGIKGGANTKVIAQRIASAIESLVEQGAEVVVPGLTEIPLLPIDFSAQHRVPVIDSNALYAHYALKETDKSTFKPYKVGIVGGVGPAATVDFMCKVIHATKADKDQDHIKLLVEQNPQIPDRTQNLIANGTDPTLALYSTCKKLESGGADVIAIPCNTAHAFVDRIQRHLSVPIVNILTETAAHIRAQHPHMKKIGIMATHGTVASGLYQEALRQEGLEAILPDDDVQSHIMDAIYGPHGVKAGHTQGRCREQVSEAIDALAKNGAEGVILGCTELPLIATETSSKHGPKLFDPTLILAKKCVGYAATRASACH